MKRYTSPFSTLCKSSIIEIKAPGRVTFRWIENFSQRVKSAFSFRQRKKKKSSLWLKKYILLRKETLGVSIQKKEYLFFYRFPRRSKNLSKGKNPRWMSSFERGSAARTKSRTNRTSVTARRRKRKPFVPLTRALINARELWTWLLSIEVSKDIRDEGVYRSGEI